MYVKNRNKIKRRKKGKPQKNHSKKNKANIFDNSFHNLNCFYLRSCFASTRSRRLKLHDLRARALLYVEKGKYQNIIFVKLQLKLNFDIIYPINHPYKNK